MTEWLLLLAAVLLTVATGFFVAAEFSLTTVDRGRAEEAAAAGDRGADGVVAALDVDLVEDLVEPPDLAAALDAVPAAREHWDAFPRSVRRAALEQVYGAKRPATREKRIATVVELAARNQRPGQWTPPAARPS